jgi:hypothetical protein
MWIVLNYIGNKINPMDVLHGQTKQTNGAQKPPNPPKPQQKT